MTADECQIEVGEEVVGIEPSLQVLRGHLNSVTCISSAATLTYWVE